MNSHQKIINRNKYGGYITLLSVIIMMSITTVTLVAMMLASTSSLEVSRGGIEAARARKAAETCAEVALTEIRTNYSYPAGHTESLTAGDSTCEVINITGVGNNNRIIQVEGYSGNSTLRLNIQIDQINPVPLISVWEFTSQF